MRDDGWGGTALLFSLGGQRCMNGLDLDLYLRKCMIFECADLLGWMIIKF